MMNFKRSVIGRQREIRILESYLGKWVDSGPIVPAVFVYGQAGTGKSLVVQHVLCSLSERLLWASVNCIETYSPRVLFAEVLYQLDRCSGAQPGPVPDADDAEEEEEPADGLAPGQGHFSVNNFVQQLSRRVAALPAARSVCLFFDHAERLRDFHAHFLDVLTRLHELCGGRVACVFASRIAWEKFPCGAFAGVEPMVLHFPNYSREELFAVLADASTRRGAAREMADEDEEEEEEEEEQETGEQDRLYLQFVNLLLDVLGPVCRDAGELVHLARTNFGHYVAPLQEAGAAVGARDEIGLWRRFEPRLRLVMQSVFLRQTAPGAGHEADDRQLLELPFFSRFLLLAAYLASYNPKAADKKFFVKNAGLAGRMSAKAKHSAKRAERTKNHLLGPKPFPIDRWMAIFYAIIEDKIPHSVCIVAQVPTLVSLNLVSQVGGDDCLSKPKFKCLVSLEMAQDIAKSVNFDLLSYLLDFC